MATEQEPTVATRLRIARQRYGLSQRKLAAMSGVSNATISLIEKDQLNPSVGTLFKIVSAFPMSMTEFWEAEPTRQGRVFYSFADLTEIRHNKVTYWQIGETTPDCAMIFQYERYEPGMDGKEIQTKQDAEMVGFVIEGRLELTVGDQRRVLKSGDGYRFNGKVPHRFKVVGHEPVTAVSCTVPPVF